VAVKCDSANGQNVTNHSLREREKERKREREPSVMCSPPELNVVSIRSLISARPVLNLRLFFDPIQEREKEKEKKPVALGRGLKWQTLTHCP
jgi:hypothetical protein